MEPAQPQPAAPDREFILAQLRQLHGLTLFHQGLKAFRRIPRLIPQYLLGLLLTLILAALLFWAIDVFLYDRFLRPVILSIGLWIDSGWSWLQFLSSPTQWILRFLCWVLMFFVAVKLACAIMGFWIDLLIEKVIHYHRPGSDLPFSVQRFLISALRSFWVACKSMVLTLGFLILGFIPILGLVFSFIGVACSSGADILNPYLLVLAERDPAVFKGKRVPMISRFRLGWFQALMAIIPILGWIAMPILVLLQIIGAVHWIESAWKTNAVKPTTADAAELTRPSDPAGPSTAAPEPP